MKKLLKMTLLASAVALVAGQAVAADWSDTSLALTNGSKFREPYNSNDISKNIYSLKNVSGDKYGSNFFNVDLLQSNSKESLPNNATGGAQEAYVVYRRLFDLNKITGKDLSMGPAKGMGITAGFDWNTKNDSYGSKKRMFAIGPTWMLDVKHGFFNVSLLNLSESNDPNAAVRNAYSTGRYTYKNHWDLSMVWGLATPVDKLEFEGWADFIGAKGVDEGGHQTKAETHIWTALMYDVSAPLGAAKNTFKLGAGYEYWKNKFGNDNNLPFMSGGAFAKTPFVRGEYHF
jgi:nucleoside-specific outer membrane channel protein Tsx